MAFSFVCECPLFFNWKESVAALLVTKRCLHEYVKDTTLLYLATRWTLDQRKHLKKFAKHNDTKELHRLKCVCSECKAVYSMLDALKSSPGQPLRLEPPSTSTEDWWILLRMYLPKGNEKYLEECDVGEFFKLLDRCQLFDEIENGEIKKIISIRNDLMHSSSNELSPERKCQYLSILVAFLGSSCFENRQEIKIAREQMRSEKQTRNDFDFNEDEFKDIREAFLVQENAIKRDLDDFADWAFDGPGLKKLLNNAQEGRALADEVLDTKKKLIGTLWQAVEMGGKEGEQRASILGRIAGQAGAFMAGRYKIFMQNKTESSSS